MTLAATYHNIPRTTDTSVESQPKTVKLIYRGYEYSRTLIPFQSHLAPQGKVKTSSTTQLIYRGQVIDYNPAPPQPYQRPRALNWRYQMIAGC